MKSPYHLSDLVFTVALVSFFAVLLGVIGPSLDDHSDEMRVAADLTDAQAQAQRELRRDLASAAICREAHGESSFTYTQSGQLVCIPRKGKQVLASNL